MDTTANLTHHDKQKELTVRIIRHDKIIAAYQLPLVCTTESIKWNEIYYSLWNIKLDIEIEVGIEKLYSQVELSIACSDTWVTIYIVCIWHKWRYKESNRLYIKWVRWKEWMISSRMPRSSGNHMMDVLFPSISIARSLCFFILFFFLFAFFHLHSHPSCSFLLLLISSSFGFFYFFHSLMSGFCGI